ncbi:mechanosensitive ion channel protein MscL [Paenibacillus sp. S28]|uniref:mechanosensitive ion channel protein MscL n=1 Tax=Paenibacillus sp. S28 TaxID=2767463 RepID=UPI00190BDBCE|nr:mechanosensitive ion channel protein MscL [Paenibacillus sp. S28]MBJ9988242.1 mechanosensitive ion channel protein MscL [Paenibacillus sp. S28]
MIVFDVIVHGEVKETIRPATQRLQHILAYVTEEAKILSKKYGTAVKLNRRIIY